MDLAAQQFVRRASRIVAEAAADLGDLIARPRAADSAAALLRKLADVRDGARAVGLVEIARLAADGCAPLGLAVAGARPLDRIAMQTVGWAVQALDGALAAAEAGCAPIARAA